MHVNMSWAEAECVQIAESDRTNRNGFRRHGTRPTGPHLTVPKLLVHISLRLFIQFSMVKTFDFLL